MRRAAAMLVEGAVLDVDGPRAAYVRIRHGRVVEVGARGTDSSRGRDRRIRGIVVPAPVNAHTHLGDAVSSREPPMGPVERLVGVHDSYKLRLLRETPPSRKRSAIRAALARMVREGAAAVVDFREEGREGVELLRAASRGLPIRVVALGRPLERPIASDELGRLLDVADGIGLSSAREETGETRKEVARACRLRRKIYALHASEAVRERPETYLEPRPDLLVHLARATPADLELVRDERVAVAVCPRSNALFGRQPDLGAMERLGLKVLLGTDNAMFHPPTLWSELQFAYAASRLTNRPASAAFLARAALVEPWAWLGEPSAARLEPGSPARPVVLRLPPDDPAYQVVTRVTEQLIVRAGPNGPAQSG